MTAAQLFALLTSPVQSSFVHQGHIYTLRSIEREDGSGKSFNVHCYDMNRKAVSLYIRTQG